MTQTETVRLKIETTCPEPMGHDILGPVETTAVLVGDGGVIDSDSRYIHRTTDRVAINGAFIDGVHLAQKHDVDRLRVLSESAAFVDQMEGRRRCSNPTVEERRDLAIDHCQKLAHIGIEHVPSEEQRRTEEFDQVHVEGQ